MAGETNPGEVLNLINNLALNKPSDLSGISPKLIKIGSSVLANPLAQIFNKSFVEGIFPDNLKVAKVFPVHKGESITVMSNYRPISILPIISKLLETLMQARLMDFITRSNIIYELQFGFQKNKSTEKAVLSICAKIVVAIDKKENACCILLDFAKAFDTVNHNILISKLEHYGIGGTQLNCFRSYLNNRKQCVQIGQTISSLQTVQCGVPQGSILGPLLFLMFINDINQSSNLVDFHLFADDTSVFLF